MTKITGSMVVLVSKYTRFDPTNPTATEVSQFTFADASALDESGKLTGFWANEGYIYVGHAAIEVSLLPQEATQCGLSGWHSHIDPACLAVFVFLTWGCQGVTTRSFEGNVNAFLSISACPLVVDQLSLEALAQ